MSDRDEDIAKGQNHGVAVQFPDLSNPEDGSSSTPGASNSPYCIIKIPQCLTRNRDNSYGYLPTIVSIGPYHNGEEPLQWIQGHKEKFQEIFESKSGVKLPELTVAVTAKINHIEESYFDPPADVNKTELTTMMVLDGCFLLTLFLTSAGTFKEKNPILNMPWAMANIRRDLLLLENQIPLVVLQTLLEATKDLAKTTNLNKIAWEFFSPSFKNQKPYPAESSPNLEAKHLLDLIRKTFIPSQVKNAIPAEPQINNAKFLKLKSSAKTLYTSGVTFELKKEVNTLLNITFENGVLQIPEIILDDFTSVVLLNCIAFEQLYASPSTDITSYIMFMGCLVNSERDAAYLIEKGIIQNYLGTDDEVVQFFKRILNDYVFDVEKSYLADVVGRVDNYSSNWFHVGWATAKQNYASSPLIFLSKLAALALLLLTVAQVVLAAIAL